MPRDYEIGLGPDAVTLTIGTDTLTTWTSYQVTCSVFDAPGRFGLRLGWGDTARELIQKYAKGDPFKLHIGGRLMLTGTLDALEVPEGNYTQLDIRGRDHIAALKNDYLRAEQSFSESSYFKLAKAMLEEIGMDQWGLVGDNTANRLAITGANRITVKQPARATEEAEVESDAATTGSTSRVIRKTLKAKLGEPRLGFLQRQFKRAGLFLWCAGDGSFILSEPNANQVAIYGLNRYRGIRDAGSNITGCHWKDDAAQRHAMAVVHGRGGGGKKGRGKMHGQFVDTELTDLGYTNQITEQDNECKTIAECEFAARRRITDERRKGWTLDYTVSGHTTLPSDLETERIVWAPDTVAHVDDNELGIRGDHYIHTVTYIGSADGTTTKLSLMRPEDLVFAEEMEKARPTHRATAGGQQAANSRSAAKRARLARLAALATQ